LFYLFVILAGTQFFSINDMFDFGLTCISFAVVIVLGLLLLRATESEQRQREIAERLSAEKSEFMAFASHEIRNPITAMRGYASMIADGTTGSTHKETLSAARQVLLTGDEVLMLISQFLDKSKVELGQITYDEAPFDFGAALSSVADGFRPHVEERGLSLHKDIDLSQHYSVRGDQGKVKEVLGNLIDNSLKYTRQGSITVSVQREGERVRAIVKDTGVGIPADVLPKLFQKFGRADAQKANLLGTGLGLYIARVFIEGMGGRVWAESEGAGKGARFIVELPAA
jgi:signal transduction histidine kinase